MPSNFTENYQLNLWEAGDKVQRTDFNADNAKIDGALAQKAERTALDSLAQVVNGHTAMLSLKGNCQIYVTSYVGDGTSGVDYPKSFTFPQKPLLVFVISQDGIPFTLMTPGQRNARCFISSNMGMPITLTWQGNTLSWTGYDNEPYYNYNAKDETYYVIALLAADQ